MAEAFLCDAIRTPIGRYGGALSTVRTDDLAALPLKALMERNKEVDWGALDDVIYGCANQAGEDNRNVARMALLLAGLPKEIAGATVNRLCGSSLDATAVAARAIKAGEMELVIAGGVESMTRAPFVLGKADSAFSRSAAIYDTTIGWRFVNPLMKEKYGVDSMPETAENVAMDFKIARADQDAFALRSQQRWAAAHKDGFFKREIAAVTLAQKKGDPKIFDTDEHPRPDTTIEQLAKLKGVVQAGWNGDRGERVGRERRLVRADPRVGSCGEEARVEAPRARARRRRRGRRAAHHGLRASAGEQEAAGAARAQDRTDGRDRVERGVRGAGNCGDARLRNSGRRRARESEWRRDRDRASARARRGRGL